MGSALTSPATGQDSESVTATRTFLMAPRVVQSPQAKLHCLPLSNSVSYNRTA